MKWKDIQQKALYRYAKTIATGLIIFLLTYYLLVTLDKYFDPEVLKEARFNYLWLLTSILLLCIGYILLGTTWRQILLSTDKNLSFTKGLTSWAISQFGKYLPGKVWLVAGRAALLKKENIPVRNSLISIVYEGVLMTAAALIYGTLLLFQFIKAIDNYYLYFIVIVLGLLILHPKIMNLLLRLASKIRHINLDVKIRYREIYILILNYIIAWTFVSLGFAVLVRSMGFAQIGIFTAMGVFLVSWVIGFLAFVVPGGLGVREGIVVAIFAQQIDVSSALLVAIVSRLWWVVGEVLCVSMAFLLLKITTIVKTRSEKNIAGNFYNKYSSKNPIEKYFVNQYLKHLLRSIKNTNAKKILDVGCGEGIITAKIKKEFAVEIKGYDLEKSAIAQASSQNPDINFEVGSIYELKEANADYDLVFAGEVLEHLKEPQKAIKEIKRVSNKYVIISVPNEPLWRIGNMARLKYLKQLGNTPGHIQNFSSKEIRNILSQYFSKVKITRAGLWTFALCEK